ncbi:hypothetical protein [Mycoplasmopsis opalescens]|uniref:hypothetical protein n=1 Tax=Mycoplasmopsis opalescens TaxID=114886 RepID=UPI0004A7615C|nr:hypothetical protein [Mycoplasmopsis opalescens]
MKRIKFKSYNYYPDFSNEIIINNCLELVNNINRKAVNGFEHFSFHELALNFSNENVKEINEFAQKIVSDNTTDLLILASDRLISNYLAAEKILFSDDVLAENKIQFHFINCDLSPEYILKKHEKIIDLLLYKNTKILIASLTEFSDWIMNYFKNILNIMQRKLGYYNALNKIFLVSNVAVENQFEFASLTLENCMIIPSILHERFSFFAENNMLLLLLKGADISQIHDGYFSASQEWLLNKVDKNIIYQIAYISSFLRKKTDKCFVVSLANSLEGISFMHAQLQNELFMQKFKNFSIDINFTREIETYGQTLLQDSKKYFAWTFDSHDEHFDYRISPDVYNDDGVPTSDQGRLSNIKRKMNQGILNTLVNVAGATILHLEVNVPNELSLGALICVLYWSTIYECYINGINPYD